MSDFVSFVTLMECAKINAQKYQNSNPFPHIVFDNFFNETDLQAVLDEFPDEEAKWPIEWQLKDEIKSLSRGEEMFGHKSINFFRFLNSEPFIFFLEKITGISNLIPDPHFTGGGFHKIKRGGYLKIHADFNKHPKTKLDRRLNVLVYLNKNWNEEFGGHFELWNEDMSASVEKILPVFNRLVIFSTTSKSYHGHPDPLNCPENMTRKSIAMYYYTNGRPSEEIVAGVEDHDTIFKPRNNERYDDQFKENKIKKFAKLFIPPILLKLKPKKKSR